MAETKSMINEKEFLVVMKEQINAAMIKAAEPVIQAALVEVEKEMRATLAKHILVRIEQTVDIRTMSDRVVFEIRRDVV